MKTTELPKAPESEKALAGAMFRWARQVGSLCAELGVTPDILMDEGVRAVFTEQMDCWEKGLECDESLVIERLRPSGKLEAIGGLSFVTSLQLCAPSSAVIRQHCETIRGKALLRGIMATCSDFHERARTQEEDPAELAQEVSAEITKLVCQQRRGTAKTLKQLISDKIDRITNGTPNADVLKTGLTRLDQVSPLRLGSMPLIAGARKAGKSMFAITVATNLAEKGHRVLYFTLEDPATEVLDRITAGITRVPIIRHDLKSLTEAECSRMLTRLRDLSACPLEVRDDTYDLAGIQAVARQEKAKHPDLACIVIDYAQLIKVKVSRGASREVEVATVSRAIRLLAMELRVAILFLCQLNKDGETRESKSLEQDCTAMWKVNHTDDERIRDLEIPFQRNGESGVGFQLTYHGEYARFENYSEEIAH